MADGFVVEQHAGRAALPVEGDVSVAGDEGQLARVLEIGLPADGVEADGAIHGAGVEEIEFEALGDGASDRRFSRTRRPVDRDDHYR